MSTTLMEGRTRASIALMMVMALVASILALGAMPASAADEGTIKVTQDSTCTQDSNANNPMVQSPFYVGGEGFSPAGKEFQLRIETQPGGVEVWAGSGTVGADGSFCVGPISVPAGKYKVTMSSEGDKDKSKVFQVQVPDPIVATPAPPSVTPASCQAPGTLVVPGDTEQYTYTVNPAYTPGATGEFTVTVTATKGHIFANEQTTQQWTLIVDPQQTEGCTPPLTGVTPVGPPAPAPADCFVDGVFNPPAPQDGVIWTVTPENQTGPGTYTVTAAPAQGYTFPAGAQTTWTVIVDPQQTEGCDAVGGTEDNDTDQNEDSDVAGSEDELAATGANFGPAGLGLLLILSGAAFVTARRLAVR